MIKTNCVFNQFPKGKKEEVKMTDDKKINKEEKNIIGEVELFDAYLWLCPVCAKKNFEQTTTIEVSEDKFRKHFKIPEWEDAPSAMMTSIPTNVKCKRCKSKYKTFREEDKYLDEENEGEEND
jgi:rubredoxin